MFDSLCWPVNVPYGSLIGMGNLTLDAALDGFLDPFSCWLDAAHGKSARLALLALVAYACWLHPTSLAAAPTITYVQSQVRKVPRRSFRIQASLLFVVPLLVGTALYLARLGTYHLNK